MIFEELNKRPTEDGKSYTSYPVTCIEMTEDKSEITVKFDKDSFLFFQDRLPSLVEAAALEEETKINFNYEIGKENKIKFNGDIKEALDYLFEHQCLSKKTYININNHLSFSNQYNKLEELMQNMISLLNELPEDKKNQSIRRLQDKLDDLQKIDKTIYSH
ncbi:MAG: hypothetical protein LEGION0398_MBIBDBAK_00221 [Legionellaceae bacterium]